MINCNIHNYRQWMDAYINNTLSVEDMFAVESFLQIHPQIMNEYLREMEEISLNHNHHISISFSHLEVNITATSNIHQNNYSQFFVSYFENELSDADKKETEQFVQLNPSLQKEFQIYSSVFITPDTSVKYPDKKSLYKKSRPTVPLYWSAVAVASITLVIVVYILWPAKFENKAISLNEINNTMVHKKTYHENYINTNHIIKGNKDIQKKYQEKPKNKQTQSNQRVYHTHDIAVIQTNINSPALLYPIQPSIEATQPQTALSDIQLNDNSSVTENRPHKKGFFEKLFSGEKIYIEEYVNATFSAFNEKPEGSDWVLKVERDESGKSKRIKFSSPIFSIKSKK